MLASFSAAPALQAAIETAKIAFAPSSLYHIGQRRRSVSMKAIMSKKWKIIKFAGIEQMRNSRAGQLQSSLQENTF